MRSPESRSPSRSRTAPEIQRLQAFRPISALSEEPSLQGCPSCSTVKACSFQVVPVVVVPEVLNDWHLEGRPVNLHESFLTRIDFELVACQSLDPCCGLSRSSCSPRRLGDAVVAVVIVSVQSLVVAGLASRFSRSQQRALLRGGPAGDWGLSRHFCFGMLPFGFKASSRIV